jgi:hypothetical protein
MKLMASLFGLLFIISCSHFSERTPTGSVSSSGKPRHVIFTVHGLSGNEETFGYMGEASKLYLSQLRPNYDVETINFIYPSGQSEKEGAYEFAFGPKGLNNFVKNYFKDRPLTSNDKISFVCHSQGGLIAYIWFFSHTLQQGDDFKYVKQTDSIITLGTPFWGSKIASILTDRRNFDVIPLIKAFAPDNFKMSRREIADMAFASDVVDTFRTLAIKMDSDEKLSQIIKALPIRLVNITGILPTKQEDIYTSDSKDGMMASGLTRKIINKIYSIFAKSYSVNEDNNRIESDIAVLVPSSRWDFIYTPPTKVNQNLHIGAGQYKNFSQLLDRSEFLFTESAHLPFDTKNTTSMAYVGPNCLKVETCDHPTFRYIVKALANCVDGNLCENAPYDNIIEKMKAVNIEDYNEFKALSTTLKTYSVQINIKLNPGQIDQFPVKYFKKKHESERESLGLDSWEFDENTLQGNVIDFKNDKKTQLSKGSTDKYKIYIGDKSEIHSVDIVSRRATKSDPFDRLRVHVTGRVEDKTGFTNRKYMVPIEIKLPGLPQVKMDTMIQPSYSTFTELDYTQN